MTFLECKQRAWKRKAEDQRGGKLKDAVSCFDYAMPAGVRKAKAAICTTYIFPAKSDGCISDGMQVRGVCGATVDLETPEAEKELEAMAEGEDIDMDDIDMYGEEEDLEEEDMFLTSLQGAEYLPDGADFDPLDDDEADDSPFTRAAVASHLWVEKGVTNTECSALAARRMIEQPGEKACELFECGLREDTCDRGRCSVWNAGGDGCEYFKDMLLAEKARVYQQPTAEVTSLASADGSSAPIAMCAVLAISFWFFARSAFTK